MEQSDYINRAKQSQLKAGKGDAALSKAFPFSYVRPKVNKRVQSRVRAIYWMYINVAHTNADWAVRPTVDTVIIHNAGLLRHVHIRSNTWGDWVKQGIDAGLWEVLQIERGFTKFRLPLLTNAMAMHDATKPQESVEKK